MTLLTSNAPLAILPQDVHELITRPLTDEATATKISTVITTGAAAYRIPVVTADSSAAAWVLEGAEIPVGDPTVSEIVVAFKKLAALTIISNELAEDSSPAAAKIVGDSIARDLAVKLDAAYFAATTTNGPGGIKGVTPVTTVSAGGSFTDVDVFTEATYSAEGYGATIDHFVCNPADGLALSKLKAATGSNVNLLAPDPTAAGNRTVAGVPLLSDPAVTAGEIWGVPKAFSLVIIRDNGSVEIDKSVYFSSDRTAIRSKLRIGFAFPHSLAIVKITKA